MAEDTYRSYKDDQSTVRETPRRRLSDPATRGVLKGRPNYRRRSPARPADYTFFKATIASAVEELKLEMKEQHARTRTEVQSARRDILAAVNASPAEYVKLLCEFGGIFLFFSLAVRFLLKIELVNTAFALFMLAALLVYWAMARLQQESEKREPLNPKL